MPSLIANVYEAENAFAPAARGAPWKGRLMATVLDHRLDSCDGKNSWLHHDFPHPDFKVDPPCLNS